MVNINLWQGIPPYHNPAYGDFVPHITPYFLDGKNNSCVIVVPGGGYSGRSDILEGDKIAEYLNSNGISACVLRYRVEPYTHPAIDADVRRAVRFVRYNAEGFNINPAKIGIIGFSAGGHLVCMSGLRFDDEDIVTDEIDKVSARPDAVCACYPVASFRKDKTHMGTRDNFLGDNKENEAEAEKFTCENLGRNDAPPFFIWHTAADNCVDVRCSLALASSLIDAGVPIEMHIFPEGHHGLDLAENYPLCQAWPSLYVDWLKHYGF